jgi:hypothetical protein
MNLNIGFYRQKENRRKIFVIRTMHFKFSLMVLFIYLIRFTQQYVPLFTLLGTGQ